MCGHNSVDEEVQRIEEGCDKKEACSDTRGWVDGYGDKCDWFEQNDVQGCPVYGLSRGGGLSGGTICVTNENCCYCKSAPALVGVTIVDVAE